MMDQEDEAFNEIELRAKQRKEAVRAAMQTVEDDDIQEYKRPWVGLTNDELTDLYYNTNLGQQSAVAQAVALLKERNT